MFSKYFSRNDLFSCYIDCQDYSTTTNIIWGIGDEITAHSRRRLQRGADAPLIWCCNGHYPAQRCGMPQHPASRACRCCHGAANPARIRATPGPFLTTEGCSGGGQSRTGGRGWQSCVGRLGCRKRLLKRRQIRSRSVERGVAVLATVQAGFFHESLGPRERWRDHKPVCFGRSSDGQMGCLLRKLAQCPLWTGWGTVVLVWDSNFCWNPNPSACRLPVTQAGGGIGLWHIPAGCVSAAGTLTLEMSWKQHRRQQEPICCDPACLSFPICTVGSVLPVCKGSPVEC